MSILICSTSTTPKVVSPSFGLQLFRADGNKPEALQAKIGTLSLEGQALLEKDTAKKEAKAEAKAIAEARKKEVSVFLPHMYPHLLNYSQTSTVTIKRIQRNKNKYVTSIHGLDAFGVWTRSTSNQL